MAMQTDGTGARAPQNVVKLDPRKGQAQTQQPAEIEALLPQNVEAEAGVLGSILIDPECLGTVRAVLYPRDFYLEAHRIVFEAICDLAEHKTPADLLTVTDRLLEKGQLDEVGGSAFVSSLGNQVPTSANVEYYAKAVRRTALQRQIIQLGTEIVGTAYSGTLDDLFAAWTSYRPAIDEEFSRSVGNLNGFRILTDLELESLPASRGILGDILYESSIGFLYGPPGHWKSFLALDWALSIAAGNDWQGRPVAQGDVLYIAAEGAKGIGKRVTAWKRRNGCAGRSIPFYTIGVPVQLLQPESISELVAVIATYGINPALVVIDTLARSMAGGDENAAKDASTAINNADAIKQAYGCCVLLVHHPGKDAARGMRGSTSWFGAADTVISVQAADDGEKKPRLDVGEIIKVTSEKPKDSVPFQDIFLTSDRIEWATNDGLFVSSLVLLPSDPPEYGANGGKSKKPTANDRLYQLMLMLPHAGLPYGDLLRQFQDATEMSKRSFDNALRQLANARRIEQVEGNWRVYRPQQWNEEN